MRYVLGMCHVSSSTPGLRYQPIREGHIHICGHWSYNGRCFRTRSGLSWFLFDPWSPVPTDYGRYPFADIGPIMDVVSRQELDSFINFQGSEALVCGYIAVQGRRLCDTINLYIFRVCGGFSPNLYHVPSATYHFLATFFLAKNDQQRCFPIARWWVFMNPMHAPSGI